MAVTWHRQPNGRMRISRDFSSDSAAARGASLLESVCDEAFQPVPQPPNTAHPFDPVAAEEEAVLLIDEDGKARRCRISEIVLNLPSDYDPS